MPVYEIPLDLLIYNKYNGRILSMVKSFERQFRELNPEFAEDKKVIEDFLWDSNTVRNKTTMADLDTWGQKKIGIVTRDGIIIDGNRRASILNRLAKDGKGTGHFMAVILDDTLDDNPKEIMRLETSYQMGEDEKLDYNPIEKYLKCKDLQKVGFSEREIGQMMAQDESKIKEWLSIMQLMDSYLDALGYQGIYTRLEKREGQFVDLNKYLNKYKAGTELVKWKYDESDIADLKAISFDYIRAAYEGKEFRAIAIPSKKESIFCNRKVWEKFRDNHFRKIDPLTNAESSVQEYRRQNPEGDLSDLLQVRDDEWTEQTEKVLRSNLNKYQRVLEDVNEENAPIELLQRAKDTLSSINTDQHTFYGDPRVQMLVKEISALMKDFQQIIKTHKG